MAITTQKLKGSISISRPQGSSDPRYISIKVVDELSGVECIAVRVSLEEFAEAVTGLSHVECEFDFRSSLVGLRREHKTEIVTREDSHTRDDGERKEIVAKALRAYEVDGWKGHVDDLFNHHKRGLGNTYRVTFVRYVEND